MKININETFNTKAETGDLLIFKNSKGDLLQNSTYLICQTETKGTSSSEYFIINLNGKKDKSIVFYNSINSLLRDKKNYVIVKSENIEMNINMEG